MRVSLAEIDHRRWMPFVAAAAATLAALVVPQPTQTVAALAQRVIPPAPGATEVTTTGTTVPGPSTTASPSRRAPIGLGNASTPLSPPPFARPQPPATSGAAPVTPATVGDHGWASGQALSLAGGDASVPAGSLPVGATGGETDKVSFFRVSGTAAELHLGVHEQPGAQVSPEVAAILACPVTEPGWVASEGGGLDTVPAYDEVRCVAGSASDDGAVWTFNVLAFRHRATAGIVLVPAPEAGFDVAGVTAPVAPPAFRVTFDPTVVASAPEEPAPPGPSSLSRIPFGP